MTPKEARELIFHRLCQEYKEHGDKWVKREPLADELNIPQDLFGKVLVGLTAGSGNMSVETKGREEIRLGASWRGRCEDMNP